MSVVVAGASLEEVLGSETRSTETLGTGLERLDELMSMVGVNVVGDTIKSTAEKPSVTAPTVQPSPQPFL